MTDHDNEISNDTVGSDGIFLRAADRRRFDYVMRAVRESSLSLALSSDSDGVLDHYGRLVLGKLRKTDGLQIEVFLPQNTEQLLERFNQILSGISLDDARRAEDSPAPRRVLIAHDAKALSARDLQLMARLVKDFPGANVSLVLLVDRAGMQLHERTLEGFGQRLLRWPVEAPTRTEGEALLKVARAIGFEVEVKKVLAATGYTEIRIANKPKKEAAEPDSSAQSRFEAQLAAARRERTELDEAVPDARTEPTLDGPSAAPAPPFTQPPAMRGWLSRTLRWTAATVLLLLVSAAVVGLLFARNMPPTIVNSPILKDHLPAWAMDLVAAVVGKPPSAALDALRPAEAPAATVPAAAADSDNGKAVNAPAEPAPLPVTPTEKAEPIPTEPLPTEPKKAEPARVDPPAAPVANADAAKTEPVKTEPVKPEAPKPEAPKPDATRAETATKAPVAAEALAPRSERGVDALVRQARPGSFFVQHVSLGSMAEAQEWRAQYGALAQARIAAVNTQDKGVKFAVVSGPFATRKEAETFAARPGVPADPWLRPVKSLQGALQPAGR